MLHVKSAKAEVLRTLIVCLFACCFLSPGSALGVILHPDDDPPAGLDKPPDDVVGIWSINASCVAVAEDYILTTRHQGYQVGAEVWFGSGEDQTKYIVAEIFVPEDYGFEKADLRVVRLETTTGGKAHLDNYVDVYTGSFSSNPTVTIGGYGKRRGDELVKDSDTYGYAWTGSDNREQSWGANRIEGTSENVSASNGVVYTSDVVVADFDPYDSAPEHYVDHEAAMGEYDSGGGWFIKVGEEWQLAALTAYVEHGGDEESWFDDPDTIPVDPDWLLGIRVGDYYEGFIDQIIPEPAAIFLLIAGLPAILRRRRRR